MSGAIDAPLLSEQEIMRLLGSAPSGSKHAQSPPRHGRPGEQIAQRLGAGLDFAETRAYSPGDDPRHIDWRASARARPGQALVRSYHAEYSRPLGVLIDRRDGMCFGTRSRLKVTQALRAALYLLGPAMRQGQEIGGLILEHPTPHWHPLKTGPGHVFTLARRAAQACPTPSNGGHGDTPSLSWPAIFASLRKQLPAGASLLLFSDFAGLNPDDHRGLRDLGRHCQVRAIRIEDPIEAKPPRVNGLALSWGTRTLRLDGTHSAQQQTLIDGRAQRIAALEKALNSAGISYQTLPSDRDELEGLVE